MLSPVLQHVLALIRRTGDRCIVVDSAKDEAFVLMSLSGYEQMVNGTHGEVDVPVITQTEGEDSTIEKANQAIAHWRDEEASASVSRSEDIADSPEKAASTEEEDRFYIEPVE